MIVIRKSDQRGHADHGWLKTYHTFSFADYFDPAQMGFRVLRVINEDKIQAGKGFGMHRHDNMEIITYVISGELAHKDSLDNGSIIKAGEFQRMSAGTGIAHSEFNPSNKHDTHLYQIWIMPDQRSVTPSYEERSFTKSEQSDKLILVAAKNGKNGALHIEQDVQLFLVSLKQNESISLPIVSERYGWVQLVSGGGELNGHQMEAGDGAAVSAESKLSFTAKKDTKILFFDMP